MFSFDWGPAITMSGIVSVLGLAGGAYLKGLIERQLQSNFDQKLEALRASFRKEEEQLRDDLRARGAQIDALRASALATMASRHAALDKRRLEAAERLWAAVAERGNQKALCVMAQSINIDTLIELSSRGDRDAESIQKFADVLWQIGKLNNPPNHSAIFAERPFLSPLVWALFSAYNHVLMHTALQITVVRGGMDGKLLKEPTAMIEMVKKALPHQSDFVDKNGISSVNYLVDELEEVVFRALVDSLDGKDIGERGVKQADDILKLADEVAASRSPVSIPDKVKN